MDFSRYTNKAQGIAGEYHHAAVAPLHILLGLLEQGK